MTLDGDTRDALGYGNPWEQLALRFGAWLVVRNARPSGVTREQKRAIDERRRRRLGMPVRPKYASDEERLEAHRARARANMATPEARERDRLRKREARARARSAA